MRASAWCSTASAMRPPRASRMRAAPRVDPSLGTAVGRAARDPRPAQRARGHAVGRRCRGHRALRPHLPRVRRRLRLSLRVQPHRRRPRRARSSTSSRNSGWSAISMPGGIRPAHRDRDEYLYHRGAAVRDEPRGNAADAAVAGPLSIHPRGGAGRLRQHEPAAHRRAHAQGRSHAVVRRRAGAQARARSRRRGARCSSATRRWRWPTRASSSISTSPASIADTSWIHIGKYVGIWWEMHLNQSTWGSGDKHGANNANVKRYIDFAAKNGFGGVLVEGWNKGWDGDWIANGKHFSFTESYPDFDLPQLAAYAKRARRAAHRPQRNRRRARELRAPARRGHGAVRKERRRGGEDGLRAPERLDRAHARRRHASATNGSRASIACATS